MQDLQVINNYYIQSEVDNLDPIHPHCPKEVVADEIVVEVDYMVDDAAAVASNREQGYARNYQVQAEIMELVLVAVRQVPKTLQAPTNHRQMKVLLVLVHYWYNDFDCSQMVGYELLRVCLRFYYLHGHDYCDPDCSYCDYPYYPANPCHP